MEQLLPIDFFTSKYQQMMDGVNYQKIVKYNNELRDGYIPDVIKSIQHSIESTSDHTLLKDWNPVQNELNVIDYMSFENIIDRLIDPSVKFIPEIIL